MIPTSIRTHPINVIFSVIFIAKLACAFTPSVVFERKSRFIVNPSKISDNQPIETVQHHIIRPNKRLLNTRTSLKDKPNYHQNSPSSSKNAPTGRNGILSSTSRESTVTAEWEPILELQHHIGSFRNSYEYDSEGKTDGIQAVNGVFCGYRFTKEEYLRLRSANPDDFSM